MDDIKLGIGSALNILSYELKFGTFKFTLLQMLLGFMAARICLWFIFSVFEAKDD